MNINLRSFREKAGLSQAELATSLGLSHGEASQYEQHPGTIPTELLLRWAQALGTDIASLLASATAPTIYIDAGDPYCQLQQNLNLLKQYVTDSYPDEDLDIPQKLPTRSNILKLVDDFCQKPNLVLLGRFDSGKSRLANALMGQKILPSQYQPATKVITFVRHLSDRPSWFEDQVGILTEDFWVKDEKGNQNLDLTLLNLQSQFKKYCVQSGSLDVLRRYGIHDHFSETEIEGHSAIVYVDSPILKSCNIVDFPGYSDQSDENSEDVKKATSAVQIADLVLYTSPVNGFINAEDLNHLSHLLRFLPVPETCNKEFPILGNLLVVGTHANPTISDSDINLILPTGSARLYKHVKETVFRDRSQTINRLIKQDDLQMRFFAFWEETPRRWENLRETLVSVLGESLPKARRYRINQEIDHLKNDAPQLICDKIHAYEQTISDLEQRQRELELLEAGEPERLVSREQTLLRIKERIQALRSQTQGSFQVAYLKLVDKSNIKAIIRSRYKNQDEARKYVASYLIEQLQGNLETLVKENSDSFKADIDEFLKTYDDVFLKFPNLSSNPASIPFDSRGAFIGGLAGIGSFGALAAWAASLGNLGAYILVAQSVSILSALGISISGGVATAVSFVAAIGGPITLMIGLAAAVAFLGFSLFGESWESRLAREIVDHFKKQKVLNKFLKGNDEYWQDTERAFEQAASSVEEQFQEYIQHLRDICYGNERSREKVERILRLLGDLKSFFAEIPWKGSTS